MGESEEQAQAAAEATPTEGDVVQAPVGEGSQPGEQTPVEAVPEEQTGEPAGPSTPEEGGQGDASSTPPPGPAGAEEQLAEPSEQDLGGGGNTATT